MKTNKSGTLRVILLVALGIWPAWAQTPPNNAGSKQPPVLPAASVPDGTAPSSAANLAAADNYVIGNEDVLAINVWKESEISRSIPVRSDGRISLPLLGEVQATGKTPKQLEAEIANGLKAYVSEPEVTVIVEQIKSKKFNILGQVQRPGSYMLNPPTTVLDAIATAGGFKDFAKSKKIYVLRRTETGQEVRIPFNYTKVIMGKRPESNVMLQPFDTVVVP